MKVIEFIKRNKAIILQILFALLTLLVALYIGVVIFSALMTSGTMCMNCTSTWSNDPMTATNLIKTGLIIGIMSISIAVLMFYMQSAEGTN